MGDHGAQLDSFFPELKRFFRPNLLPKRRAGDHKQHAWDRTMDKTTKVIWAGMLLVYRDTSTTRRDLGLIIS